MGVTETSGGKRNWKKGYLAQIPEEMGFRTVFPLEVFWLKKTVLGPGGTSKIALPYCLKQLWSAEMGEGGGLPLQVNTALNQTP